MSDTPTRAVLSRPGFRAFFNRRILGLPLLLDCIQVEVTSRCPGRCTYCPHTTRRADWVSRDMELATFARLEPLLHRTGRVHLQGWGEPLLNPAFFDMAATARRAGCAVSTTTCGLNMDEEIAGGLVASGIDIAAFSFAGTDPESNRSRAGVDFDRVCDAIGCLKAARAARRSRLPAIHLAYLLLASNLEAVRGLPALMRRLGVQGAVVSTLDYIAAPGMEADAYLPHEAGKIAAAAEVLEETAAEAERFGLLFHYELPQAVASVSGCRENAARSLFVSADGLLSPCIYVNVPFDASDPARRVFGSILEEDPLAIWRKPEFRRFRDRICGSDPDLPCRGCPKRFMG
jgi:MoaA/NifB/PqqE/SkfB family radical SAM enzyme